MLRDDRGLKILNKYGEKKGVGIYQYLIFIISLVATVGSLYFSEVKGFIPCDLCWYQRILMYPIVFITLVGLLKKDLTNYLYVLPLSILGNLVSLYHVIIQFSNSNNSEICSSGVSCNIKYIEWFGFVTIPVLSLTAFTLINIIILLLYLNRKK